MRVVLLGPPGVGKGTQGHRLADEHGWALISTGEILRAAVAQGTPLGLEARKRMDRGLLVPDDVMIGLVWERTLAPDAASGFVLDGFPRTVVQADALDSMLQGRGFHLDRVVAMSVAEEELVRRLSSRRECPVCKRVYNMKSLAPMDGSRCDDHPEAGLVQRADDTESTIRRRFQVYWDETAPLFDYYRNQGRLCEVPGAGPMDEVYRALTVALGC